MMLCMSRSRLHLAAVADKFAASARSGMLLRPRPSLRQRAASLTRRSLLPSAKPTNMRAVEHERTRRELSRVHSWHPQHWTHDATRGPFEHQPGFLNSRTRC